MELGNGDSPVEGDNSSRVGVRLYVGGLGPSVTSSDLHSTFSTLGRVSAVDFVRTKGRNFAYMTIEHASPQDLQRFFSLYNGCMWKGGRLKLENAKEHYLEKLKREWAERDFPNEKAEVHIPKSSILSPATGCMESNDSKTLNIFFPKMRKVKKIPEKGLGRHKRSFERVDAVPCSLLQLCHCSPSCKAALSNEVSLSNKQLATPEKDKGKALNYNRGQTSAMNSKLPDKATKGSEERSKRKLKEVEVHSAEVDAGDLEHRFVKPELKKLLMNATEDVELESTLIRNRKGAIGKKLRMETSNAPIKTYESAREPSGVNSEKQHVEDRLNEPDLEEPLLNITDDMEKTSNHSKSKSLNRPEIEEPLLNITEDIGTQSMDHTQTNSDSETEAVNVTEKVGSTAGNSSKKRVSFQLEANTTLHIGESKADTDSMGTDQAWIQKSSWKSLVGETGRVAFSLGSILGQTSKPAAAAKPSTDDVKPKESRPLFASDDLVARKTFKGRTEDKAMMHFNNLEAGSMNPQAKDSQSKSLHVHERANQMNEMPKLSNVDTHKKDMSSEVAQAKSPPHTPELMNDDGKVCTFMRTDNSEQEWMESKRIVKEMTKKTRKEAIRSMKAFHKQKY